MTQGKYTYEEIFQRNIGVFTKEEQLKIKNLKVAIAGAGGIGGPVAYNLARLGVGEIRLADDDTFEPSNLNRQFGAYIDTIGTFKAETIVRELRRINPYLNAVAINERISAENVDTFLEGVDVVVDAIDFFEVEAELLLHTKAQQNNNWVFMGQAAMELMTFTSFNPELTEFQNMIVDGKKPDIFKAARSFFPVLPKNTTWSMAERQLASGEIHTSYVSSSGMGASFLTEELIRVCVKDKKPFAEAPSVFVINLDKMTLKKYN